MYPKPHLVQIYVVLFFILTFFFIFTGCKDKNILQQQQVVVYTSLDKVFSQPILDLFEKETGIKVLDVYDSEATKTTGLVNHGIRGIDITAVAGGADLVGFVC
ncbi:MAG: hypothetical protein ACYTE8_09825 [Planctomycetota bacterium]|jgi:hypothetical protein